MSERFEHIVFDTPLHGLPGNFSTDCIVAKDGYDIVRSSDRIDVLISHHSGVQFIVPWSRVRQAKPIDHIDLPGYVGSVDELPSLADDDEPPTGLATPNAKKRGGWPKGKPRKELST